MPAVHVIDAFVLIAISRGEAGARLLKMGLPPAGPPPARWNSSVWAQLPLPIRRRWRMCSRPSALPCS